MSKIDVSDIQGFALKGYNFPWARYLLLELLDSKAARDLVQRLLPEITTGERWDINSKPTSTVNLAFTHKGLIRLELPPTSLLSFPLEFQQERFGTLGSRLEGRQSACVARRERPDRRSA
jgi:hypothetical protein